MTPVSITAPIHLPAAACLPEPLAPAAAFLDSNPTRGMVVDVERPGDAEARESLLDRAFGPGRFAKPSTVSCERLRARRLPAHGLSLVARVSELGGGAEMGGDVVGTVRLWHVAAGERDGIAVPALMLGPLAVEDAWRCHRLGARLMEAAIERARAAGHGAILLVGDEPYYRRFGFRRVDGLAGELAMPGPIDPARFLALELAPGALAGARGMVRATGALDLAGHSSAGHSSVGHRSRRPRRGPGRRAPGKRAA